MRWKIKREDLEMLGKRIKIEEPIAQVATETVDQYHCFGMGWATFGEPDPNTLDLDMREGRGF